MEATPVLCPTNDNFFDFAWIPAHGRDIPANKSYESRLIELAEAAGFRVTSPSNQAQRGGTITVWDDNAAAITKELIRREFIVDFRPGAGVRISPHFYTKDEELDLVIEEMKNIRDTRTYETIEKAGAAF